MFNKPNKQIENQHLLFNFNIDFMFTINEFEFVFSRIQVIMRNTGLNMINAINRIGDTDFEDFVNVTKSSKTMDEFYRILGAI